MASTIALCMIVRDEAEVIERCLRSVRPLIDSWVICDTGSVDGTPDLIHSLLRDIPGRLVHRPWRDFGHNRSELMELAFGAADYLLLVDADMTVKVAGELPELTADAYLLRHDGSLGYWVPRLVRGGRRWQFVGSTHEYLSSTDGLYSEARLDGVVIEHHADGGCRADKFERDRRLLEAELVRDPTNSRAVFYLAQTMRDLGDHPGAIELYQQRVRMGGWEEEVFYAAYQAGVLLASSDWDRAVPVLLDAWERRPTRAEPLYSLAYGYRCREQHHLALLFAERGLEVPVPDDVLFVERHVYDWSLLFEWSVAAARLGDLDGALGANDQLCSLPLPEEMLEYVRHNREWCLAQAGRIDTSRSVRSVPSPSGEVRRLDELMPGTRIGEIRLAVEPAWPQFNPTIAVDGDEVRMIVRTGSWTLDAEGRYQSVLGDGTFRTLNYLVELDGELQVRRVAALVDLSTGVPRYESPVRGYEDCRLVRVGDRWYATATVRDQSPDFRCQMVLLALDGEAIERVAPLRSPDPTRHEKNWIPVAAGDELHLIYSCDPTTVLRCDTSTGQLDTVVHRPGHRGAVGFRGGSQGVAVNGGRLTIVHEVALQNGRRRYTHRFVLFGGEYEMVGVSPPFCFASPDVEFCAGLARRGGQLLMTFGIGDRAGYLAVSEEHDVLALLGDAS